MAKRKVPEDEILWRPQPKQALALGCPFYELFYGGAKGGGKSDFLLMDFVGGARDHGKHFPGIVFRRTYPELEELQKRALELYVPLGARYHAGERTWTFPGGATLKMRHLEREDDCHHYQGHQYAWVGFDELTDWKTDYAYVFLMSCARSAHGVPVRVRAAGNPGGVGHVWVRQRFVDVAPPLSPYQDPETGQVRIFVPALLDDNLILMAGDPQYEERLKALPAYLYRAYRLGDWDIFAGQVFEEWRRDEHVVRPFPLEPSWKRFAALDWGYAKPYSLGWWCVTGDGRLIRYRENYGCAPGRHNEGVKKPATELAAEAWAVSVPEGCNEMVMDPACWSKIDATDESIAEKFERAGWLCTKGLNDRVNGVARMHELLQWRLDDGRPGLLVFDTCRAFIRTVPALVADPGHPELYDTDGEDHVADETRYAVMSRMSSARVARTLSDILGQQEQLPDYDPLRWGLS